ncbi:MAG: RNA polymerase sigma factor [Gammaproteobacteria bacterium]|nr:RNA polymerase sigma factor [Gammaproteobacteria bacterium]
MANIALSPVRADSQDELAMVRRIMAGEQAAFAMLMRRFNRQLYRLARAIIRDDAEAEDALQDAYLSAYRSLRQFRGDSSLATWLSRLVINQCLQRLRRHERRQNVIPMTPSAADEELERIPSDAFASPDEATERAQMRDILERKIDALPESFRAVLVLRSVEELTVEETAECLGIPAETVRSRHFRARSLLREALAREVDLAERDVFGFAGARCDRIVARVLARLTHP